MNNPDRHGGGNHNRSGQRASGETQGKPSDAVRRTVDAIEGNPLSILVGGLAVGAIAGALLPRSDKEKELLAPLGRQVVDRARAATGAARDAGKAELATIGLSKDAARSQAKSLFEGVTKAIATAGTAAKDAAAKPVG